jgi:hypothetical protein
MSSVLSAQSTQLTSMCPVLPVCLVVSPVLGLRCEAC